MGGDMAVWGGRKKFFFEKKKCFLPFP